MLNLIQLIIHIRLFTVSSVDCYCQMVLWHKILWLNPEIWRFFTLLFSNKYAFYDIYFQCFYSAMHYSAKRGIAIACMSSVCPSVCLSVRLSVTLVNCDRTGWNSSKIISPLVSLGCSLFAASTWRVCSKGNTPKFGPKVTHPPIDLSVGDIRSQIAAEWLQIAQRTQWRAYRKPPSLFLMVSSLTPTTSPSPKMGVPYAPNIREWPYLCNRWSDPLHVWF